MIAATILTAGASSRMGSPKALLKFRGLTFLENILAASKIVGLEPIVVLGHHAAKIKEENDLAGVTVAYNEELEAGPIGSIRAALRSLRTTRIDAILVWPIDYPHVSLDTVRSIVRRFETGQQPIVIPTFHSQRGHPVIFARDVFAELVTAPNDQGARAVVWADPTRVASVEVPDSAIVDSINTPDAYRRLLADFEGAAS